MGIRYVKFTLFAKHTIVFLIFPGLIETLPAFVGMFFQESSAKTAGGTRTLVPFHDDQQVFVLISRIGFRNINFSFFLREVVKKSKWKFKMAFAIRRPTQSRKNLGSRVALLPGKFLRVRKVFARRT